MAKSLKTAFIRVSCVNNTQNGVVNYSENDIVNIVQNWSKSKRFLYYIKGHNQEKDDPNPHIHIVLKFNSPTPFENVKEKFPYGDIENARNIKNCVQYLVHMNDFSKTSYDFDSIITNDPNINKYRYKSISNQLLELNDYIRRIETGEIREFNLTDNGNIPIEIFTNYKSKIINALEYYRRKVMTDKDRNIKVMIFTGDTGTFKTTYAKQYAKNNNQSICISSSSNDPMQDYMGEDILVLDDIRDTTFKFHDLLKVLDNHTKSSVQSRYSNKAFIGDTIIITSSVPLSEWYFNEKKEDKEQLYRRIPVQMQFTKDNISVFQYDDKAHKYIPIMKIPNVNNFKVEDSKNFVLDTLKSMGVEISQESEEQFINFQFSDEYKNLSIGELDNILNESDT